MTQLVISTVITTVWDAQCYDCIGTYMQGVFDDHWVSIELETQSVQVRMS